jgi:hypothetical protein
LDTKLFRQSMEAERHSKSGWIFASVLVFIYLAACSGLSTNIGSSANKKPFKLNLDLAGVVLGPEDLADLYQGATYSITQGITSPDSRGVVVTYPTQALPHTTAFAEGFMTRIEIFKKIDQAVKSYDSLLAQQSGEIIPVDILSDSSQAFSRTALTPEGFDLESVEYTVLFRERNAVGTVVLRTTKKVTSARLNQLTQLVIDRLGP